MKALKWYAIAIFLTVVVIPLVMYTFLYEKNTPVTPQNPSVSDMQIMLYRKDSDSVQTLDCYTYMCGVVAAEMPASYEPEALKAQTVAAFTYMLNKMNYEPSHKDGAFVCDDYNHCKAYLSEDELSSLWGSAYYNKMYTKIQDAVLSVLGKMITYNDLPINAVFHNISGGKTASALEVWGSDIAYLQSVLCESDKECDDYKSQVTLTNKEFSDVFFNSLGVVLPENSEGWIGEISYHPSGYVNEINIGGTMYSGTHIRKLFSLKSAFFEIDVSKSKITFNVCGHGHGVGMSQHGANALAKQGKTYDEILKHFYTDVKIEDYVA